MQLMLQKQTQPYFVPILTWSSLLLNIFFFYLINTARIQIVKLENKKKKKNWIHEIQKSTSKRRA